MIAKNTTAEIADIQSRLVSFPGRHGSLIVAYLDEGPEGCWNGRFVVLSPKYGETKKNNLRLSYFLVANGFKTLRFDHTNHVGESDGDMEQFTLPGGVSDILDTVTYVENHFEPEEIALVSNSLSARCAYRAAALDQRISRVVCLVGVVNLEQTIKNIYQKDIIGSFRNGKKWGVIDILGFDIDSENFISCLVEADMHNLDGAEDDARKLVKPLLHLHAEKDIWVDHSEVKRVVGLAGGELVIIDDAFHDIGENPEAAMRALEDVARFCLRGREDEHETLLQPLKKRVLEQNREERNRLRQIYEVKESETEFWDGYLGKFGTIEQANVYIDYFEKIQSLLGDPKDGDVVLDSGCGNGFWGLCLLHSMDAALKAKVDIPRNLFYYGIDLAPRGLGQAYRRQSAVRSGLLGKAFSKISGIQFGYQRLDFDRLGAEDSECGDMARLPFSDGSVDKICCSLMVSYLKDPEALLREFFRILKPGGIAVVSSMKPDCDMTVLFHEFITMDPASTDGEADAAQRLLGAAGKIKLKEQSGIYGFYSEGELVRFSRAVGFVEYDCFRSLGDQANVIRITK